MTDDTTGDLFASKSRADQIFARFCAFHAANPHIWQLFERYALQATQGGRDRYSIAMIAERIRWHVNVETQGDDVKINNDYKAYYSRMFMAKHPTLGPIFKLRRRSSTETPAYTIDMATYNAGLPINETQLMARLREM